MNLCQSLKRILENGLYQAGTVVIGTDMIIVPNYGENDDSQ